MFGAVSDDEVVVLKEGLVLELDKGDVMGLVGKEEAAYGYHAEDSKLGMVVVSFVVGRIRAG